MLKVQESSCGSNNSVLLFLAVANLSQPGTFAGNDAIVAFARSQQVKVVIHQLNTPLWEVGADTFKLCLLILCANIICYMMSLWHTTLFICCVFVADQRFREAGVPRATHCLPLWRPL